MKIFKLLLSVSLMTAATLSAENTFEVTGTAISTELLKLNYGTLPKSVGAYDLNICNLTQTRQPITSSEIFQALAKSQSGLRPIGRQIMLAAILRNQNHSIRTWLNLGLNSTSTVLSIAGTSRTGMPSRVFSASALGVVIGQQLLSTWSPVLTADPVQKFEAEVLESALVMDGGSCVERTVFTANTETQKSASHRSSYASAAGSLDFYVR